MNMPNLEHECHAGDQAHSGTVQRVTQFNLDPTIPASSHDLRIFELFNCFDPVL